MTHRPAFRLPISQCLSLAERRISDAPCAPAPAANNHQSRGKRAKTILVRVTGMRLLATRWHRAEMTRSAARQALANYATVCAGRPGTEDYDEGRIISLDVTLPPSRGRRAPAPPASSPICRWPDRLPTTPAEITQAGTPGRLV